MLRWDVRIHLSMNAETALNLNTSYVFEGNADNFIFFGVKD
jgi:hypothetical protein